MHLVVTPATKASITDLSRRAHQSPYTQPHLKRLFRRPLPERSLVVPHGYRITFTVGQFRPGWLARHLAVAGPNARPSPDALAVLLKLFDFHNDPVQCLTWEGGPLGPWSLNILEPVDGKDWAPLSRPA